ncbi:MAG: GGDEF domain-containing protein [Roseburia sp.]|nr:GGDEF domain-containing protein [Roseburia sp.]
MNFKSDKFFQRIELLLAVISFTLILLFSCVAVIYRVFTPISCNVQSLEKGWVNENGKSVSLDGFDATTQEGLVAQRVYCLVTPTDIDTALIFRCRNCFANVYVDGELVYKDDMALPAMYGRSPGSRWHLLSLDSSDTPVELCLEVTASFYDSDGLVDNIYIGSAEGVSRRITASRVPGFIINTFMQLIGLVLIVLYAYLKLRAKRVGKDFLYLGCATFFSSQWSSTETLLWQFFFGYSEVFHLIGYFSLAVTPLSFGLLASYRLKGKMQTVSRLYALISGVNAIVISVLNVAGILEFHYSLVFTHVLLFLLIPIVVKLVLSYAEDLSEDGNGTPVILILSGILAICIATAVIQYRTGSYASFSLYARIAILSFLSCLIIYHLNQIANTFTKSMKADMLHDLALTDHLTELFNRTAFNEHKPDYEHLIDSFSPLGVIQFDVNNLKKVNDTLGHEKGDQLICTVSEGLKKAFTEYTRTYRMGGDEFLTVIFSPDPDATYKAGIDALNAYCDEQNQIPDLGFRIQVAHGYMFIKGNKTLSEAIDEADALMYENKKFLKMSRG